MKKIMLFLLLTGLIDRAQAQEEVTIKDIPEAVANSFKNTYHAIKDINWRKVGNDFEAAFDLNDTKSYAIYDENGKLIRTESEVHEKDLPKGAVDYVKKTYDEDEIRHPRKVTDANGVVTYKGEVKENVVYFDSNGVFIKSEKVVE